MSFPENRQMPVHTKSDMTRVDVLSTGSKTFEKAQYHLKDCLLAFPRKLLSLFVSLFISLFMSLTFLQSYLSPTE